MGERNNGYASCELRNPRVLGGLGNCSRRVRGEESADGCSCRTPRETSRGDMGSCGCGCSARQESGYSYKSDRPLEGACSDRAAQTMMHKLQQLDFSIQETVLYLDAYPDCATALKHYHQLVCERRALAEQYENKYGPLVVLGNVEQTSWQWVRAPWPWQSEFPGNKQG